MFHLKDSWRKIGKTLSLFIVGTAASGLFLSGYKSSFRD